MAGTALGLQLEFDISHKPDVYQMITMNTGLIVHIVNNKN